VTTKQEGYPLKRDHRAYLSLNQWLIDDMEHFFGCTFCGRQKRDSPTRHWEHYFSNTSHHLTYLLSKQLSLRDSEWVSSSTVCTSTDPAIRQNHKYVASNI
jgi:hypothetical protein